MILYLFLIMSGKKITFREKIQAMDLAFRWTYRSSRRLAFLILGVIILGGLLTILEPYAFQIIIDSLVQESKLNLASQLGLGIIGVLVIYAIARSIQSILWDVQGTIKKVHSQKLDKYVSTKIMDKISSLDSAYFENPDYYNTLEKANQNFFRFNEFFWQLTFFLSQFVSMMVRIGALFVLDPLVVGIMMLSVIPSVFLTFTQSQLWWDLLGDHLQYLEKLVITKTY